jgi:hypothetical protein
MPLDFTFNPGPEKFATVSPKIKDTPRAVVGEGVLKNWIRNGMTWFVFTMARVSV